ERPRLAQRLARWKLARRPGADPAGVVAGEDLVRGAVLLLDGAALERAGDPALVAEQLVQHLGAEREERREERLQRVDHAERDVEHGGGAVAIGLHERPRRL